MVQDKTFTMYNQRSENSFGNHFMFGRLQKEELVDTKLNRCLQG